MVLRHPALKLSILKYGTNKKSTGICHAYPKKASSTDTNCQANALTAEARSGSGQCSDRILTKKENALTNFVAMWYMTWPRSILLASYCCSSHKDMHDRTFDGGSRPYRWGSPAFLCWFRNSKCRTMPFWIEDVRSFTSDMLWKAWVYVVIHCTSSIQEVICIQFEPLLYKGIPAL